MSRKKFRYNDNMTEDDLRKEIYRDIWYNLSSDIRRERRSRDIVSGDFTAIRKAIDSMNCPGGYLEESGSFVGIISSVPYDC